ncbi:MAG: DNA-binding NtrC family response regulator [Planctomycetota bacterium]|jgi:DNA-binding NtrC family response regulator
MNDQSDKPEILLIDDQPANLDVLCRFLERAGYAISVANNGQRGIEVAQQSQPDLVLLDVVMAGMDGYEVCRRLKAEERTAHIPVIFITGRNQETDLLAGFTAGGVDYIAKPIQEQEVLARVQAHVRIAQLMGELARANQDLRAEIEERQRLKEQLQLISAREATRWGIEGFIGRSKTMQAILEEVQLLQEQAKTSVLITGESGTGKELIARAIHLGGARREEAFVAINCAAIPSELGESMLFGHAKGAFTGATSDRPGYFEMANSGTLFMDEIGEMPLAMQAKILRVLEDGQVWRVGEQHGRQVDVRIIAATNAKFEQRIADGQFREDLYYRLAAYTVKAPALRERVDDIELLVQHFLQMFADEMGVEQGALSDEARHQLESYSFPGNVRELKNAIERAVLESRGGIIEVKHLHLGFSGKGDGVASASMDKTPLDLEGIVPAKARVGGNSLPQSLDDGLAEAEVQIVEQAVREARGNVSEAARLLGTSRTRLYRILGNQRKG